MSTTSDKRIAGWLGCSLATYYRWRRVGLLPERPRSVEEARCVLDRVRAAQDAAIFRRPTGVCGRTRLQDVARELRGGK